MNTIKRFHQEFFESTFVNLNVLQLGTFRGHSLCFKNVRLRKLHPFFDGGDDMNSSQNQLEKNSESTTSLETVIAVGLFGWLALSMTLMGLGIW